MITQDQLYARRDNPDTYQPWDGVLAGFDKTAKRIFFVLQDARETETPWINSASSWTDIAFDYVDLFDSKYHNVMFAWCMSSVLTSPINGTYQDVIRKGLIGVDNFIFYPMDDGYSSISGKSTPFTFAFDNAGNPTNWSFGGYYPDRDSATSKSTNPKAIKCFNGEIESITIWDTVLTADAVLNSNSLVQSDVNGTWGAAARGDHPLTSSSLANYKSNCVAHFQMREGTLTNRLIVDQAGTTVSGNQTAPTTGHTLYFIGGNSNLFGLWDYIIYDVAQGNPTISFSNGYLQFVDEAGLIRNIGTIFYDLGIVILDNEYVNSITNTASGLPFLQTISTSGMGFANLTGFNIHYVNYDSVNTFQRLIMTTKAEGDEFNITQNQTGIIKQTGEQLLTTNPGTYITTVGLYNAANELLAVAKLDRPIRKDEDHTVTININIDF